MCDSENKALAAHGSGVAGALVRNEFMPPITILKVEGGYVIMRNERPFKVCMDKKALLKAIDNLQGDLVLPEIF